MEPLFWKNLLIFLVLFNFVLRQGLELLNLRHQKTKLPAAARDIYSPQQYAQSQLYTKEKTYFKILSSALETSLLIYFLQTGFLGWLYHQLDWLNINTMGQQILYLLFLLLLTTLLNLPFELYEHFYLEKKYQFNRMKLSLFFQDKIKEFILSALISSILLSIIIYLWSHYPNTAWFVAWVIIFGFVLLLQYLAPKFILPLFNRFTPLPEGTLRQDITQLAQKLGYTLTNIYLMDGSKRTSKANAFLTGFGQYKKIALFDTLLDKLKDQEILAVLAHELGHFKLKHIFKNLILFLLQLFIFFYLASFFLTSLQIAQALNFKQPTVIAGLIAFMLLFSPLSLLLSIVSNYFSRTFEKQADKLACKYIDNNYLISALKKLAQNNLSNLTPHPLYVFFHYSHPPLLERLAYLSKEKK